MIALLLLVAFSTGSAFSMTWGSLHGADSNSSNAFQRDPSSLGLLATTNGSTMAQNFKAAFFFNDPSRGVYLLGLVFPSYYPECPFGVNCNVISLLSATNMSLVRYVFAPNISGSATQFCNARDVDSWIIDTQAAYVRVCTDQWGLNPVAFVDVVGGSPPILFNAADQSHYMYFKQHVLLTPRYVIVAQWQSVAAFSRASGQMEWNQTLGISAPGIIERMLKVHSSDVVLLSVGGKLTLFSLVSRRTIGDLFDLPAPMSLSSMSRSLVASLTATGRLRVSFVWAASNSTLPFILSQTEISVSQGFSSRAVLLRNTATACDQDPQTMNLSPFLMASTLDSVIVCCSTYNAPGVNHICQSFGATRWRINLPAWFLTRTPWVVADDAAFVIGDGMGTGSSQTVLALSLRTGHGISTLSGNRSVDDIFVTNRGEMATFGNGSYYFYAQVLAGTRR
jgi:hypothetical protein